MRLHRGHVVGLVAELEQLGRQHQPRAVKPAGEKKSGHEETAVQEFPSLRRDAACLPLLIGTAVGGRAPVGAGIFVMADLAALVGGSVFLAPVGAAPAFRRRGCRFGRRGGACCSSRACRSLAVCFAIAAVGHRAFSFFLPQQVGVDARLVRRF